MIVMQSTHVIDADDGYPIELHAWVPAATPARAVVQIAHGMGEHARRYAALAEALARIGCVVVAGEHRGHGAEAARRQTLGDLGPRGFDGLVADMLAVSDFASARHPGLPLILLGHSMGSFAVLVYLLDHAARVSGAALVGTVALDLAEAGAASAWKLTDANPAPAVARRTPYDWLSRDEAQVDAYIADPLCGFRLQQASRKSMYAAYRRTTRPESLAAIPATLPIYLAVGDEDAMHRKLAYFKPLVERLQSAGLRDVHARVYEGARHEVFHETNREEVVADFAAWVERIVG